MNKLINDPKNMVSEMLDGYTKIYSNQFKKMKNSNGLIKKNISKKVAIVIGGGAGNEPWMLGYVGDGLADGASIGDVYTAPPAKKILELTKEVDQGEGILYISNYHTGDLLNFGLVSELAELEGIDTKCIFVSDDIGTEPIERKEERRGVAGIALVVKIAGAASESGLNLEEVYRITTKAKENTYTFSVTTSPGYMPGTGKAMFTLDEGEIEYGMGFNGETGVLRTKIDTADKIVEFMMEKLLNDVKKDGIDKLGIMINGFGFTSILELCIVGRKVKEIIDDNQILAHDIFIDSLFAPQGSGGFSISIIKLDDELIKYYDKKAYSPFFKKL